MKILEIYKELLETINNKDVIDFNDINLSSEFNGLNDLLFRGEIVPIPIRWGLDKDRIGSLYYVKDDAGKYVIRGLRISKFYNLTYGQFKNTLAHEMIHVYLLQQGIDDNHDEPFLKEMNRINGMGLGFNITVSEEFDDYPVISSHVKAKELVFFTFKYGGSNHIILMTNDTYKNKYKLIANGFKSYGKENKDFVGSFWLSSNRLLRNFRIQKIIGDTIKIDFISGAILNEILKDSKKLSEFSTNGKKVIWG